MAGWKSCSCTNIPPGGAMVQHSQPFRPTSQDCGGLQGLPAQEEQDFISQVRAKESLKLHHSSQLPSISFIQSFIKRVGRSQSENIPESCCAAIGTCIGETQHTSKKLTASVAKNFSCQRPRTLAVVYVIPSSPDRGYQKIAIKDLFILLIKPLISQNVCQRQPQRVRPVLSLQDAPSDCQGNTNLHFSSKS